MTDSDHNSSGNPYGAPRPTAEADKLKQPPLITVLMLLFVAMLIGIATFFCTCVGVAAITSPLMRDYSEAAIVTIVSLSTVASVSLASGCFRYMIRHSQNHEQQPQSDESTASDRAS